jgi:hypothetical protein
MLELPISVRTSVAAILTFAVLFPVAAASIDAELSKSSEDRQEWRAEPSVDRKTYELTVPFLLPERGLSEANADAQCKVSPQFIFAMENPSSILALSSALTSEPMRAHTVVSSNGTDARVLLPAGLNAFLSHYEGPHFASCLSRCVVLIDGARPLSLDLTAADGVSICAQVPNSDNRTFQSAVSKCRDGTEWREVRAHPGGHGSWLVCGTVVNSRLSRPTKHHLKLQYEMLPFVSIGRRE